MNLLEKVVRRVFDSHQFEGFPGLEEGLSQDFNCVKNTQKYGEEMGYEGRMLKIRQGIAMAGVFNFSLESLAPFLGEEEFCEALTSYDSFLQGLLPHVKEEVPPLDYLCLENYSRAVKKVCEEVIRGQE